VGRLAREAAKASSGSTPAGSEKGKGATCGEEDAGARPAVERPLVSAAVTPVEETVVALAAPTDGGGVRGHERSR